MKRERVREIRASLSAIGKRDMGNLSAATSATGALLCYHNAAAMLPASSICTFITSLY
jgi:hypothetical protein